jgi:mRNA interferase RelE/StbE
MAYSVQLTPSARKDVAALAATVKPRVAEALLLLADDPRPHGCKKLVSLDGWRLRVGDYRIRYLIDDEQKVVTIVWIGLRGRAYRDN